jgi:WD40 repeat protein
MRLIAGFEAAPPEEIPVDAHPHVEEPTSMAMRPDGTQVLVALGEHLFIHDVATGRLLKGFHGPGKETAPRNVAWSPDGTKLLVNVVVSGDVYLLDADSGAVVRTFQAPGETTAIAFSGDGALAAVGTEAGPIVVFDVASGGTARTLSEPAGRTDALGFGGGHLVASGADGVLRVWDPATGTLVSSTTVGVPLVRLAVRADGTRAATGDQQGHVRLHGLPDGAVSGTLGWHEGLVRGITFAGPILLTGDADRQLAVWDLP